MIIFYTHGGSGNHGCEAIIRGTKENLKEKTILYTGDMLSDIKFGLNEICEVKPDSYKKYHHPVKWFFYKIKEKINKKQTLFNLVDGEIKGTYLSVGGDNYCYPVLLDSIISVNKRIREKGNTNILWGTSIEPDVLENQKVLNDIKGYDLIFTRESITYEALKNKGLKEQLKLYPDPAFGMNPQKVTLPKEFKGNVIGINISPLILSYEKEDNYILEGYLKIIDYILENTDNTIALIPHVVKKNNSDIEAMKKILNERNDPRIIAIEEMAADKIKYVISNCEFFIGARTHSTIAAYSSCVPTMVIGYSVKAKGIAKDLFGTYEKYVVDVRNLSSSNEILESFKELYIKKNEIRNQLMEKVPIFKEEVKKASNELIKYIEKKQRDKK